MVFAGGEGLLLLIQPASIDAATSKLASTFIIASFNISTHLISAAILRADGCILRDDRWLRQRRIARAPVLARPTLGAMAPSPWVG